MKTDILNTIGELIVKSLTRILVILLLPLLIVWMIYKKSSLLEIKNFIKCFTLEFSEFWDIMRAGNKTAGVI